MSAAASTLLWRHLPAASPAPARAARAGRPQAPLRASCLLDRRAEAKGRSSAHNEEAGPQLRLIGCGGFTLLELLVAITVLSIVSLIAWRGLDSLVHTRERLQPEAEEVRDLLVAFGQMERDLAQVISPSFVPLPTPPLLVRSGSPSGFELIRIAPATPGAPSALQLVIYELRDGRLVRHSSASLDKIGTKPDATLATTPLLNDVQALRVRVWQAGRGWVPPEAATQSFRAVPGIEVQLDRADGRQYRRVLLVG
jgi:general secretion pathway protein J